MVGVPRSPLKMLGGKSSSWHYVAQMIPGPYYNRYIEPFCGSAAIALRMMQYNAAREAIISDANIDTAAVFHLCKDDLDLEVLIDSCRYVWDSYGNTGDGYYRAREAYNRYIDCNCPPDTLVAATYLYLNKHCFNGMMRYNRDGKFNGPFGKYARPPAIPEQPLRDVHAVIQNVEKFEVRNGDFELVLSDIDWVKPIGKGDIIYMDPPYIPTSDTASFVGYRGEGFTLDDHRRVDRVARQYADRGARVIVSGSYTPETLEVYGSRTTVQKIEARRSVAADGGKRGTIGEALMVYQERWWLDQ